MSEQRLLVTTVIFFSVFFLLIGASPVTLGVRDAGSGSTGPPTVFQPSAVINFSSYSTFQINDSTFLTDWLGFTWYLYPVNGNLHEMNLIKDVNGTYEGITLQYIYFMFFGYREGIDLNFYGPQGAALGPYLTGAQMNFDDALLPDSVIVYNVSRDMTINTTLILAWDDHVTYTTAWDAFMNQTLKVLHGVRQIPRATEPLSPELTPLQLYQRNLQALFSFALDPRIPFLIRMLLLAPIGAFSGFLIFWIGKTILHG